MTRERDEFPDFYADMDNAGTLFLVPGEKPMPPVTVRVVARGPIKSKGPEAINRQLDNFKAAIESSGAAVEEAFVAVLAPGWLDHFIFNEYYTTEEEFLFALADALREEYRAVVAAGFVLQIDDPGLPDWWDMLKPEPTIEAYPGCASMPSTTRLSAFPRRRCATTCAGAAGTGRILTTCRSSTSSI